MHPLVAISGGVLSGALMARACIALFGYLRRGKQVEQSYHTSFLYSGNLKQTSLVDAMQLLEIGKREGILHVYHGRRKGYVAFSQGMAIDAFYRNATGRDAVFAMMTLPEGDFHFESKPVNQPRLITDTIMDLVMMYESYRFNQVAGQ